jgi:hypothetical protein
VATSAGGTALSQAQASAKAICDCLKTGQGVAEAVASAAASGNAQAAAQAIAEAAGGESAFHILCVCPGEHYAGCSTAAADTGQVSETAVLLQCLNMVCLHLASTAHTHLNDTTFNER